MEKYFSGTIKDGEFIPHTYERERLNRRIGQLEGKQVKANFTIEHGIRSNQQNKYLWGVVYKMIGDELGEDDLQVVHYQMCVMFHYKLIKTWDENTGMTVMAKVPDETSSLTTTEFSQYVEKIRRWAASFLGLNIPDPNEAVIDN